MLFLLLRLLTAPTPVAPAVAVAVADKTVVETVRPTSAADARLHLVAIEAGPRKIQALMRNAQDTSYHATCVAQRLAEAQVHVTLARDEMRELERPTGDKAHAARRLALLAERTAEVEKDARLCIEDELSTISATRFEVEVSPAVEAAGDLTEPPRPEVQAERPPKQ
jgi:hypothetical protein